MMRMLIAGFSYGLQFLQIIKVINMEKRIRAVIYRRVSTEEQAREGYSLAAQKSNLLKYCNLKEYEVVGMYADEGLSGRNIKKRPEFLRMLEDAQQEKFDVIIIWSISRLSRSVADLYNTWVILEKFGVSIESQTEAFDTNTAMGRAMFGLLGVFAQLESDVTSERVKVATRERAEQGKRTCHYILGYDNLGKDSFSINEKESEIIRYIYQKYIEFRNFSAVAECCNLKGYRGKLGKPFKAESIKKILMCPVYIGYNRFKGKLYKGDYKPLIDVKMFDKIQRLLKYKIS